MKRMILAAGFVGLMIGCSNQPAPAPAPAPGPGGINISAPGVNITVDPKGGTKVQAPGVNVEAGDKGAKVNVPGVEVNVPTDKK